MVLGRIVGVENVPDELLALPWSVDFRRVVLVTTDQAPD
jgi:hypothetical protein